MKKSMVIMVVFFILIALSLSMIVDNRTLLMDSLNNTYKVRISFTSKEKINHDELVIFLKTMEAFSDKSISVTQSENILEVNIKNTKAYKVDELRRLLANDYGDELLLLEYGVYDPPSEPYKVIMIYIGLFFVLCLSLLKVVMEIKKIKIHLKNQV